MFSAKILRHKKTGTEAEGNSGKIFVIARDEDRTLGSSDF